MRTRALGALLPAAAAAALTGAAGPVHAQPAEGRVIGTGRAGAIPGRYIVTLKNGSAGFSAPSLGDGRVIKRTGSSVTAAVTAAPARGPARNPAVRLGGQGRKGHIARPPAPPAAGA